MVTKKKPVEASKTTVKKRGTATQRKKKPDFMVNEIDRYRMIAEAAYFEAEKRGFVPGHEVQDWCRAEHSIDTMLGQK